jgi:methylenetetrahydrofolate reductase (NADPH)
MKSVAEMAGAGSQIALVPPLASSAVVDLLGGYSIEVTPRSKTAVETCRTQLPPGSEVYIASIPGGSYHSAVTTAIGLAKAGLSPVPHIAARNIASFTQLTDFLTRLAGDAGVNRALVIGGDNERPAGPYGSGLELLQTGAFQRIGIRRVGIACYAEPNRRVEMPVLEAALADKLALLAREGFDPWLISQFCFDSGAIVAMIRRLRAGGVAVPLRVGIAGPSDARTLWKYALHCGIGNSMRALGTHVDAISNLLVRSAPDEILGDIAAARAAEPELGISGVHFFSFGGVLAVTRWANAILAGSRSTAPTHP